MDKVKGIRNVLWVFIAWISFFWLTMWFQTPNCASNVGISSTNWCSTYNSGSSRYCNDWNWITLYNQNNSGVSANQSKQTNIINQYLNHYNSGKSDAEQIWQWNFNTTWWIWNLQKLLWVSTDCKLWNGTLSKFYTTDFCSKIDATRITLNWSSCPEWKEVEWSCCKPISCDNPPQANWECESGYVIQWTCCVMECSVPTEERHCNRSWWDWNDSKCKCECNPNKWCCGVQLNVPLPFIGDCIEMTTNNSTAGSRTGSISVNQLNAFPVLVKWITKILVTLIMIFSIIVVIVAWLMMTTSVASEQNYKTWLEYLKKVLISLILLWTSWLILKLINPSFFGG